MVSASAETQSLSIVLAECDLHLRQLLRDTLESQEGHRVVGEAASGSELVRTVLALEPQVLVFDTQLPGCSGLDALRQVTQQLGVAAVALTAERDQDRVRQFLISHELTYLVKPIEPHQLGPAVLVAWARCKRERLLREENATLRQTLENRKVIERAKGVLMKRHRWSEPEAYRSLQREAMNQRLPMAKLAQAVLDGTSQLGRKSFSQQDLGAIGCR